MCVPVAVSRAGSRSKVQDQRQLWHLGERGTIDGRLIGEVLNALAGDGFFCYVPKARPRARWRATGTRHEARHAGFHQNRGPTLGADSRCDVDRLSRRARNRNPRDDDPEGGDVAPSSAPQRAIASRAAKCVRPSTRDRAGQYPTSRRQRLQILRKKTRTDRLIRNARAAKVDPRRRQRHVSRTTRPIRSSHRCRGEQ